MSASLTALAYLIAAVLFVLALRGLSSPVTSRQGNRFGMIGMGVAVVATLAHHGMGGLGYGLIFLGIIIGGAIGTFVALRIQMTALPQLVAAFHSLVGLAAVFVAAAALNAPEAFGIGTLGNVHTQSLIEMSLGLAIGAVTFSGSLIAFAKLQALMSGAPITFPGQHKLNLGLGILLVVLIVAFVATGSQIIFWLVALLAFGLGFLIIIPIGGADMPVVVSMLNSYSGWAAAGIGFTIQNLALIITGSLVGASGAILSYIMCKGMNRSIINVLLGGFGSEGGSVSAAVGAADRYGQERQRRGRRVHYEERLQGDRGAWLRHGGGAGAARAARDGRHAQEGRGGGEVCHPPGCRSDARAHECAVGRSQCAIRRGVRVGGDQQRVLYRRRGVCDRRQRRDQSGCEDGSAVGDLRYADPGRGEVGHGAVREAVDGVRVCRCGQRVVLSARTR